MTESFNSWWNGAPVITVGSTSNFAWWHNGAPVLQLGVAASGSISGASAMVFGTSATLTATGSLAGAAAMVFGTSASLVDAGSIPPAPIGGTAAMTFGTSATMTATGSIGGACAMIFGTTCDLGVVSLGPGGGNAVSEWKRAGPMNVRIPWLDFSQHPWKYRKVSPKRSRAYHLPY